LSGHHKIDIESDRCRIEAGYRTRAAAPFVLLLILLARNYFSHGLRESSGQWLDVIVAEMYLGETDELGQRRRQWRHKNAGKCRTACRAFPKRRNFGRARHAQGCVLSAAFATATLHQWI
jgi:hypothetical protein